MPALFISGYEHGNHNSQVAVTNSTGYTRKGAGRCSAKGEDVSCSRCVQSLAVVLQL